MTKLKLLFEKYREDISIIIFFFGMVLAVSAVGLFCKFILTLLW